MSRALDNHLHYDNNSQEMKQKTTCQEIKAVLQNPESNKQVKCASRMNLSAYFWKIFGLRERTYLVFGAHFGAERGLKTMDNLMCYFIKQ